MYDQEEITEEVFLAIASGKSRLKDIREDNGFLLSVSEQRIENALQRLRQEKKIMFQKSGKNIGWKIVSETENAKTEASRPSGTL